MSRIYHICRMWLTSKKSVQIDHKKLATTLYTLPFVSLPFELGISSKAQRHRRHVMAGEIGCRAIQLSGDGSWVRSMSKPSQISGRISLCHVASASLCTEYLRTNSQKHHTNIYIRGMVIWFYRKWATTPHYWVGIESKMQRMGNIHSIGNNQQ